MSGLGQAQRVDDALGDPGVEAAWRSLAEARSNPFLTPDWFRASLAAYPGEEPFPIVWRRDGEVRGVLPLVRVTRGPLKVLRFAGVRRADWVGPVCLPEDEEAMGADVAQLLWSERHEWNLLRVDRLDVASAWSQTLVTRGSSLGSAPRLREDVLPYIALGEGGYEGYLAGRSRNFRSQLGRRRRRLERDHGLTFRLTEEPERLQADLDAFFALHDERWSRRGGSSSDDPAARRHLRGFAAAALERGWLRLWTAEADGAPAACWYGWRFGDRYCYALAGLAERYEPLSLGSVLLAHTIEQAAAEGAPIYDLMLGDETYKERFATDRRETATWVVGRRGHLARSALYVGVRSRRALTSAAPYVRRMRPNGRSARA